MSTIEEWTKACQNQLNNPNWYPWLFEAAAGGVICTGAECPLIAVGKNKGAPNFKKRNMSTKSMVFIPTTIGLSENTKRYHCNAL